MRIAKFAGWELDLISGRVTGPQNQQVSLTTKELRLLYTLIQHPLTVLNRVQIMYYVADREWHPTDRSIDVLIGKLRRKLEDDASRPRLIRSERGVGYVFIADVEIT